MADDKRTHNIVTSATEDAIVEAVQKRIGASDYSATVRFIVREFAVLVDPDGRIFSYKPLKMKRNGNGKTAPDAIPGVARGFVSE